MIETLFYVFASVIVISSVMVVTAKQPVHSVLFLILAFFNAAGIFLLAGAEFLAMLLVIVYVGAVAVLFLFVVMMLDVDFKALRRGFVSHLPIGLTVALVLLAELVLVGLTWSPAETIAAQDGTAAAQLGITNTEAIGRVLYTDYVLIFQASGLVLLVAMVGAITLALRAREGVKRQSISAQIGRKREDSVEIRQVSSGEGVSHP